MNNSSIYLWLYSPCGPWPIFQSLNLYSTPWTGDQPVARPLPTHRTTQTENKRTQTSMPRVGFEPTIPVFQRAKMVHALYVCMYLKGVGHKIQPLHRDLQSSIVLPL
jgi:hypothetical protein